jgi:predicted secreted protein
MVDDLKSSPGKRIVVLAHCLLNQNTVVKPLASHVGVVSSLIQFIIERGYGVIQLPCPETIYLGLKRWWMSREQYDTASYREFSRRILEPYIKLLEELVKDGCEYIIIGIEGSPSCAVKVTTSNPCWFGEPHIDKCPPSGKISSPGVFIEMFLEMIREKGLREPLELLEVDHKDIATKGIPEEVRRILEKYSPIK